jgi:hypothetical protein
LKTVTVKLHDDCPPDVSLAVQVTVVTPVGKSEPDGGEQRTIVPEQLSEAAGGG